MRKILTAALIFAGVFFLVSGASFFHFRSGGKAAGAADTAQQPQNSKNPAPQTAAASGALPPPKTDRAEKAISGQVIYDARIALPPQALLEVKLTETDKKSRSSAVIAETRCQPDGTSPLSWVLPIKLGALDKNKTYGIQAKISSGDTLLFVDAAPTALDLSRAAYIIRLAKIDDGSAGKIETHSLIGTEWRAAALANKTIGPNAEISLMIDNEEKTDPAGSDKLYQATGSSGCNRYQTTAAVNEAQQSLKFSPLSAGFIACVAAIARRETDFTAMMGKVSFYKIDETGTLYLLDAGRNPLARFTVRPQ